MMNLGDFSLDPAASQEQITAIRFELAPNELASPKGAHVIVREALIPFVVWPDVPVRVLEPRQLGRMEVFVLEAGMALGHFDFRELEVVTGVPSKVIEASACKLLRRGIFKEISSGVYDLNKDAATQTLATKNIEEEHHRPMTFVYFPRQDIVIADPQVAGQLHSVTKKLRAPHQAPFAPTIERPEKVEDFLEKRIAEEGVFGYAHRLLGLGAWSKPPSWPKLSPCYYGSGYIDDAGESAVAEMQIWGFQRRKSAPRAYHCEKVRLSHVSPLLQEWASLTEEFDHALRVSVPCFPELYTKQSEVIAPGQWRLGVTHEEAMVLSLDRWLTEPVAISVCSPTAKVDVRLSFEPVDARAAELFALDAVAQRIDAQKSSYSERALGEHIHSVRERYRFLPAAKVSRAQVEERLWNRKRFMAIYQHRADEDFTYA